MIFKKNFNISIPQSSFCLAPFYLLQAKNSTQLHIIYFILKLFIYVCLRELLFVLV